MRIQVFLNSKSERPCYERMLDFNESVSFDFNLVYRALKLLYGSSSVVLFECN